MLAFNRTRNKGGETNLKVYIQIICQQSKKKKIEPFCVKQFKIFSATLLTFAPLYFDFP